jgi:hypothetical protein
MTDEAMTFKKDFLSDRSEQSLLAEIRRVATELRKAKLSERLAHVRAFISDKSRSQSNG